MVQEIYVPLETSTEIGLELENTRLREELEQQMFESYRIPHYICSLELAPAGRAVGVSLKVGGKHGRSLSPREIDELVDSVQDRFSDVLGLNKGILPDSEVSVR